MARKKGTNIALVYEPGLRFPFDARQLVANKADLYLEETWKPTGSNLTNAYNGMIVAVGSDEVVENRGVYYLADRTRFAYEDAWVKLATLEELSDLRTVVEALEGTVSDEITKQLGAQLTLIEAKQDKLVSGKNIKTINNQSLLVDPEHPNDTDIKIEVEQKVFEVKELPPVDEAKRHTYYKCEGNTYVYDDETSAMKQIAVTTALEGVTEINGGDAASLFNQ